MIHHSLGFPIETVLMFVILALTAIIIDLYAHHNDKPISLTSAILWSLFWVAVALGFALYLYLHHGSEIASLFITGYVLEKALSVDNLFVIMALFSWFAIPNNYRHRLLYWGVIGAIIFRAIFVVIGTGLLSLGPWMELFFSVVVALTGFMMLKNQGQDEKIKDYSEHFAYRIAKRIFPSYPKIVGHHFLLTRKQLNAELTKPENSDLIHKMPKSALYATPLFLCVVVIELSDVMFAFDSVPAVIAVSQEPLVVYSAMIFAILGLRTMYFVLEAMQQYLVHLGKAVVCLLFFIAAKLALNASDHLFNYGINISPTLSLYIVLGILSLGIIASFIWPNKS
ncbi:MULTISPECIES: TerC/Alx family metal homeostasis membrane protein [unclassified Gilliamella]|uniref:TerC/Alx family metal homeostasis membrane protein n=1 Tax=unclassified Gilliamella TaxID=2685620 RepID=UPI00226AB544|nr:MULTISPECIES: TerC/Alx family metal homeostasis membrane protein [unclassified Gilliamella]MCX8580445.1 TerC/Alx family metal homeostasis membrane protein [Gilliamella sp. B3482]MCX8595939.1 TerC/Alx family metal homeostasis membrane protein [Gilliamella sp. B3493]MCX8598137.1 TerC/Alx family metal homeostasis membrane protein [Gilliamella sp. B3486]MCX8660086.1 TerC/Alx family metal homeostasis membrane protein [Gilliamella sp. B2772]MCX8661782.1 TerC/Alx family metal homeostasis membrane 